MKTRIMTGALCSMMVIMTAAICHADLKVGDQLPKLNVKTLYNNSFDTDVNDLDGYVVVVEFWATWCGPCRAAIPHMNDIFEKTKDKGVLIISLSDENDATVKPFVKQFNMKYLVGSGSKSGDDFGVNAIPHAFLTDTHGKVIWAGHPMAGLEESIANAVKEYKPVRRLGGGPAWNAHLLDEIESDISNSNFGAARDYLKRLDLQSIHPENPKDELGARYVKVLNILGKQAEPEYAKAIQYIQNKNYDEAIEILKSLAAEFPMESLGKKAAAEIDRIEHDPTIIKERTLVTVEKIASNALKRAQKTLVNGNKLSAYHRLASIMKKYPETRAAVHAGKLIEELKSNKEFKKIIDAQDTGE